MESGYFQLVNKPSIFSRGALLISGVLLTLLGAVYLCLYREYDLLIVNGLIVDGTGIDSYKSSIAISHGRITEISRWKLLFAISKDYIDAHGQVVAPGFIDVHTHVEASLPQSGPFEADNFLRQGVTTLITGNCGRSRVEIGEMLRQLDREGTYVNLATLVGHNSVRSSVMEQVSRPPTSQELRRMWQIVVRAMENGALGFSTGLVYTPGRFAQMDEIIVLARASAERGGLYVSHIRDEARDGEDAIREALAVGRMTGAVTQISHFKCSGRERWNTASQRLHLLDEARAVGQDVYIDAYPYDHSSTTTDVLLPDWALADKRDGIRRAAQDQAARKKLRGDILDKLRLNGWLDLSHVRLVTGQPEWVGLTLAEAPVQTKDIEQQIENLIDISIHGGAQAIFADMNEVDVRNIIAYPFSVFGSDSAVRNPDDGHKPHPRGLGTFPRVFGRYVRDQRSLELSQAVRKASAQAAEIFGLNERGRLVIGNWADIVIFDPDVIQDKADYEHPFAHPIGITYVIVNGIKVIDNGFRTNTQPSGSALRRKQ